MTHLTRFGHVFVWTGGALFVLALAAAAYMYFIVWATPAAPGETARAVTVDALLFGVFAAHHSLLARERIRMALARVVPERLLRSVYVWTASLLLLVVLALWQPVGGSLYDATGPNAVAHAMAQLAGLWLIARAAATIDPLELAGVKPAARRETLHVEGPYRWVRHPLYLGWFLLLFGTAHMTGNRLTFAGVTGAYLLAAIPFEERSLVRAFGDDYRRYRARVRWRVLPYVY